MGLMGGLAGMGAAIESSAGYALRSTMDELKAQRIAENTSRLRLEEDLVTRGRNAADAATERARIDTEARGFAEKRGGLMAGSAGLNDAEYRGDEGIGVNVQKGTAEPTIRDRLLAKGDYAGVAADERAERTAKDMRADKEADNLRADKQLALQEKQERRLAGVAATDQKLKQIQLGQAQEVEQWRKKAGDKTLTPEERAEAKEMYQILSGKDADQWEIIKVKDQMGMEVVTGRQNKKTGAYQKFTGDGFADTGKRASQEQVEADAQRAVATGKITREEANKRLLANGYAPLPAVTAEPVPDQKPVKKPTSKYLREGGGNEEIPMDTLKSFAEGGLLGRGGVFGPK